METQPTDNAQARHTQEQWEESDFQLDIPMMICKGEHALSHHEYIEAMRCRNALLNLNPEAVASAVQALEAMLEHHEDLGGDAECCVAHRKAVAALAALKAVRQ